MAFVGSDVYFFKECRLKVPDGNGGSTWKDFREDELHRPLILSSAIDPNVQTGSNLFLAYSDPQPRKGKLLSELEINVEYEFFTGMVSGISCPKFLMLNGGPAGSSGNMEIYGWIDRAEPVATKGPKSNTRVYWHVDYWFTLQMMEYRAAHGQGQSKSFALGAGRFRRGPEGMARPDPSAPRKWLYSSSTSIKGFQNNNRNWAIILATEDTKAWLNTTMYYFPIGGSIAGSGVCPDYSDIYGGTLLTRLGISGDHVIGAWASPVRPQMNASVGSDGHRYWYKQSYAAGFMETFEDLPEVTTSDTLKVVVTDQNSNIIATLPWGTTINRAKYKVDVGVNGAQLIMSLYEYDPDNPFSDYQPTEIDGRQISIPLITIPMFSSAMSDYVLSGQRQYDLETAKLQRDQALWSGVANLGSSAIGGAVAGSVAAPGVGTAVGAVAGLGTGIASAGFNYGLSIKYDYKSQQAVDTLIANQAGNVIQSAGGQHWSSAGLSASIVVLTADPLSKGVLETEQEELGYITDVYTTGAQTAVASGGGFRIEGLEVKGDISPEARRYVAAMFDRGVHLDIIY